MIAREPASDGVRSGGTTYQLAFFTPGMRPSKAMFRKQQRQSLNFR
jgi:hypothetical protein